MFNRGVFMRKRILSGLILAVILAIVSLGVSSIRGEMNWNDIMSRKWTQRIGRNLIFPYRALLAGLSVRRRDISLLLTERIISFTQLYRWSAYNTPFHKQLATCTD